MRLSLAILPLCLAPALQAVPPDGFQGLYLTSWSAGAPHRIEKVLSLAREGRINAIAIDIKDASGVVAYRGRRPIIRDIDLLVRRLHAAGLYVIARMEVFQDPVLARARPELAVHRRLLVAAAGGRRGAETLWLDRKGLAWMDPAAEEVWAYNLAIAQDALGRGFDEINFDYVRFPSDGDLQDLDYPVWTGAPARPQVLEGFFSYLRKQMPAAVLSVDLFGLTTVNTDDLGVGQVIESTFPYFDYVCPMVYPSHYAPGFRGFANPAEHPYDVVAYSLASARKRLAAIEAKGRARAKLRPWLQSFSLGAVYDEPMIATQIEASRNALGEDYCGYLLWSPSGRYTAIPPARVPTAGRLSSSHNASSLPASVSQP